MFSCLEVAKWGIISIRAPVILEKGLPTKLVLFLSSPPDLSWERMMMMMMVVVVVMGSPK